MKVIEKVILVLLAIVMLSNCIFPTILYAAEEVGEDIFIDDDDLNEEQLKIILGEDNLKVIQGKVKALVDYKVDKKIPIIYHSLYEDYGTVKQENADKELERYLSWLKKFYKITEEITNNNYGSTSDSDWDYTDATSKQMAKELRDYILTHHNENYAWAEDFDDDMSMFYFVRNLIKNFLTPTKIAEYKVKMDEKYFPPQTDLNLDTFEAELSAWLDEQMADLTTDYDRATYLLAFFHEWFFRIRMRFNLDNTVLKGLTITEDVEGLRKIKANKMNLADYITQSRDRLVRDNNLYDAENKDEILLAYYILLFHTANVVLDKFPDDVDVGDVQQDDVDDDYVVPDGDEDDLTHGDGTYYYETEGIGGVLDTVLGFLTYIFKLGLLVPGLAIHLILSQIASVGQNVTGLLDWPIITFEDILFNRVPLLDVNILSPTKTASGMELGNLLVQMRINIAGWYVAFRNLAIVISLAVLIYIGIKVAINSTGEGRARFKEMLRHWVVGFALIFILHIFISFVLHANTALVEMFAKSQKTIGDYSSTLLAKAFDINLVSSWGAAIMYTILMVVTLIFCIIYIKRMLITSFLVIVAPLVTISYSIDKIGNNRSEILNQWLKEFCYNVLIQPFHCIVYMVFVGTAVAKLEESAHNFGFGNMIYAVVCLLCIFTGEKIVRQIFGFTKSKSVASKLFSGAMITQAIRDIKQVQEVRNSGDEEEEEETTAPATMPDGTPTETAMKSARSTKDISTMLSETEGKTDGKNTRDNIRNNRGSNTPLETDNPIISGSSIRQRGKLKTAVQKIQDHTPVAARDAGSAYIRGVKNVTGISMVQGHIEKKREKAKTKTKKGEMSQFRKQFLMASDVYARQSGLTKKQLDWKIRELRQTSFDKLESNSDRIYKMWIDKMDKDFLRHGSRDARKSMTDFIDDKYTGA